MIVPKWMVCDCCSSSFLPLNTRWTIWMQSFPESLITAIAEIPCAVASATIVSVIGNVSLKVSKIQIPVFVSWSCFRATMKMRSFVHPSAMIYNNKTFRTGFILMLAAEMLIIIYAFLATDSLATALQTTARLSGRLSLALFSWIVIVHQRDVNYKSLFLILAVAHGIHMVELIAYQYSISNITSLFSPRVAGGMLAYTFIYAMPIIQSLASRQKLKEKLVLRLEYVYVLFIWIVFVAAYIPRLFGSGKVYGGTYFEFVILFVWLIVLFAWKLFQLVRKPSFAQ